MRVIKLPCLHTARLPHEPVPARQSPHYAESEVAVSDSCSREWHQILLYRAKRFLRFLCSPSLGSVLEVSFRVYKGDQNLLFLCFSFCLPPSTRLLVRHNTMQTQRQCYKSLTSDKGDNNLSYTFPSRASGGAEDGAACIARQ